MDVYDFGMKMYTYKQGGIRQEKIGRVSTKYPLTTTDRQGALYYRKSQNIWGGQLPLPLPDYHF